VLPPIFFLKKFEQSGAAMSTHLSKLVLMALSCLILFSLPRVSRAQVCDSSRPYGDPLDFDGENGLWYDWNTGSYYYDGPTGACGGGELSWGYDNLDDYLLFADWYDDTQWYTDHAMQSVCDPYTTSDCVPNPTLQCSSGWSNRMLVNTTTHQVVQEWCEPSSPVPPPEIPPVEELAAWFDAAGMFFDWAIGLGPWYTDYGDGTVQTEQMQQAPGIQGARDYFFYKNRDRIASCQDLLSVTDFRVSFGLKGLIDAGGNATRQFVGSFYVDIVPDDYPVGSATFTVYNVTSLYSFLYHLPGVPEYGRNVAPYGGNAYQTFSWQEQVCRLEG
jgi:hypothetical protein